MTTATYALALGGVLLLVGGCWILHPGVGLIVAGIICVAIAAAAHADRTEE